MKQREAEGCGYKRGAWRMFAMLECSVSSLSRCRHPTCDTVTQLRKRSLELYGTQDPFIFLLTTIWKSTINPQQNVYYLKHVNDIKTSFHP